MKKELQERSSKKKLEHVALIMDGNGRWAESLGKGRTYGHKMGAERIGDVAKTAIENDIKAITLYAFSTENWKRPKAEVTYIMNLIKSYFKRQRKKMMERKIRFNYIGDIDDPKVDPSIRKMFKETKEETKDNDKLTLTIAFNYGAREEIVRAVKKISSEVVNENKNIDDISFQDIKENLYTYDLPDIDLVIRTSGEVRLSNYLLLQLAYSELYFTKTYWPAFDKVEFEKAIENYYRRDRRFGGL